MANPRGQIAYFRIYPERTSRLHFRVRVFQTVAQMRRYLRSHSGCPWSRVLGRHGKAMCSSWTRYRGSRIQTEVGEIVFAKRFIGMEVISHETTHAALGWARRLKLPVTQEHKGPNVSDVEERFCYGLGQMARQISSEFWKRGLVK